MQLPLACWSFLPAQPLPCLQVTFQLAVEPMNQAEAEFKCQDMGGHLAAYTSAKEQQEVEGFYVGKVRAQTRLDAASAGLN
jgi:hypothetical protein